jgi:hypothetical protein
MTSHLLSRYRRRPWHERSTSRLVLYNVACLTLLGIIGITIMALAAWMGPQ